MKDSNQKVTGTVCQMVTLEQETYSRHGNALIDNNSGRLIIRDRIVNGELEIAVPDISLFKRTKHLEKNFVPYCDNR